MDTETIRTLITCGTSILCIIASNIFIYISSKTNEKKSKNVSILEQQYNKIFSPIHKILFFTNLNDYDKITKIYNIIYSNYQLSTELLREEYNKCASENKIRIHFEILIDDGCKCLEKALGYTKTKLNKQQKEISKNILYLNNLDNYHRVQKIITISVSCISIIITLVIYLIDSKNNIISSMEKMTLDTDLLIIVFYLVCTIVLFVISIKKIKK